MTQRSPQEVKAYIESGNMFFFFKKKKGFLIHISKNCTSHLISLLIYSTLADASKIPVQTFKIVITLDSSISSANSVQSSPDFKTQ